MAALLGQGGGRRPPLPTPLVRGMAARSGLDGDRLAALLNRSTWPYSVLQHRKPGGGSRTLLTPAPDLMRLQRRVLDEVLAHHAVHTAAYAYRPRRSVVECAQVHCRAHTVIRLDVAGFFDNIRERHVYASLRRRPAIGEPLTAAQAYELTLLCTTAPPGSEAWINRGTGDRRLGKRSTDPLVARAYPYRDQREGFLPQGAPTSGALSNLVMYEVDVELSGLADRLGLRYTRYADDLIWSSRALVPRRIIAELVTDVRTVLATKLGLHLNDAKTRVSRPGSRRLVLGLLVDGPAPRVPRETYRRLERHVRGVRIAGLRAHATHMGYETPEAARNAVDGLLSWVRFVEPAKGRLLTDAWSRALEVGDVELLGDPTSTEPPSNFDTGEARDSIAALLRHGSEYRSSAEFADLMRFIGGFHRYAPFNAMVVRLQRPGSTFVLTEARWRREYRRVPKPGAQRIMIFQPRGPYMVTYDVGDTEPLRGAPPLPHGVTDPVSIRTAISVQALETAWSTLLDNSMRWGVRVTLVDHAASACGRTYRTQMTDQLVRRRGPRGKGEDVRPLRFEVEVNRNLPVPDRLATLVHELAHLSCGHLGVHPELPWPDRRGGTRRRDEVEAEATTYLVLSRLDSTLTTDDYLLGHLGEGTELPDDLRLDLMVSCASRLLEMLLSRQP